MPKLPGASRLRVVSWLAIALAAVAATWSTPRSNRAAEPDAKWKLVWSDEFDGAAVDPLKWDFDIGNGFGDKKAKRWIPGWGNNELEYYTRSSENVGVKDGMLYIRALEQPMKDSGYTSARLKSRKADGSPLFNQKYGRFEFRAKLPAGKGIWPALWMLPQDNKYGGWPCSGEIDVMEARGQEPNKVLGTIHFGLPWPANVHVGEEYVFPNQATIEDFHVYAVEWEPGEIRWYVDDKLYSDQRFWWSPRQPGRAKTSTTLKESDLNPWPAPFDQPFFIIMNLAIGGNFLGPPDNSTTFPAEMLVDYVRVYEKESGYGPTKPRGEGKLPTH
ncbi:MAG TPA: glycoside hydrolase family 16 protein [Pirellulales bacterium]|jgi:beta-glucanase (GH16 family)